MATPSKLHYVKIGPDGTFLASGGVHSRPEDVDAIFAAMENEPAGKLTLHMHGGLNTEANGMETAGRIANYYQGCSHAVSFVWETGFAEIVKQRLEALLTSPFFQKIVQYVTRGAAGFAAAGSGDRGARGQGQGPPIEEVKTELV